MLRNPYGMLRDCVNRESSAQERHWQEETPDYGDLDGTGVNMPDDIERGHIAARESGRFRREQELYEEHAQDMRDAEYASTHQADLDGDGINDEDGEEIARLRGRSESREYEELEVSRDWEAEL